MLDFSPILFYFLSCFLFFIEFYSGHLADSVTCFHRFSAHWWFFGGVFVFLAGVFVFKSIHRHFHRGHSHLKFLLVLIFLKLFFFIFALVIQLVAAFIIYWVVFMASFFFFYHRDFFPTILQVKMTMNLWSVLLLVFEIHALALVWFILSLALENYALMIIFLFLFLFWRFHVDSFFSDQNCVFVIICSSFIHHLSYWALILSTLIIYFLTIII